MIVTGRHLPRRTFLKGLGALRVWGREPSVKLP